MHANLAAPLAWPHSPVSRSFAVALFMHECFFCVLSLRPLCVAEGRVVSDAPQDPTLDKFFALHNSEDNSDFKELVKVSQERQRKAKPWLYKDHNPPQDPQLLLTNSHSQAQSQPAALLALESQTTTASSAGAPVESATTSSQVVLHQADNALATRDADRAVQRAAEPTDGYGTTGQGSQTLLSWPHTNKSALYYDSSQRDVVPFTEAELADMVQGPPKQIKHSATRFPSDTDTLQQPSKVCPLVMQLRHSSNDVIDMSFAPSVLPLPPARRPVEHAFSYASLFLYLLCFN